MRGFLFCFLLLTPLLGFCQDNITLLNGNVYNVKIIKERLNDLEVLRNYSKYLIPLDRISSYTKGTNLPNKIVYDTLYDGFQNTDVDTQNLRLAEAGRNLKTAINYQIASMLIPIGAIAVALLVKTESQVILTGGLVTSLICITLSMERTYWAGNQLIDSEKVINQRLKNLEDKK